MNIWGEQYPGSLTKLMTEAEGVANVVLTALIASDCPTISDLYSVQNGKVKRNSTIYQKMKPLINARLDRNRKEENEIKGLYLFGDKTTGDTVPVYVGISGSIFRRLKQHSWGKNDNESTLAYLMAQYNTGHNGKRSKIDPMELERMRSIVRNFKFAVYPESDDYRLYFLEVYVAGALKTKWNRFKTH